MRTTVELSQEQVAALKEVGQAMHLLPQDVIQEAIARYLSQHKHGEVALMARASHEPPQRGGSSRSLRDHPAFGVWKGQNVEGLAYERRMRAEWDHRE